LRDVLKILPKMSLSEQERLLAELEKLEELKIKKRAQEKFLSFTRLVWPSFISGRHHEKMAHAFERVIRGECKRLIINMPPRHKLLISEEIPTISGFKRMQDIAAGDYVFGPDGKPRLVTGKSDIYTEKLYRVITSDGAVVQCDGEHLWSVRYRCEKDEPLKTYSTLELLERQKTLRSINNVPKLPRVCPVEYPHSDLPIDPYVLGVWLGDGSSCAATIGCGWKDMKHMREQIEACGYATTSRPGFQQFGILNLHVKLRALGVYGNKHIPEQYLTASIEQRRALLQGLIDTDGDVTKEGKITFNNSNERLIEDVLCLVHSFGVKARITHRQTHYKGKPSKPSFRIMFKMADAARIPRKQKRCRAVNGNWARTIWVEETDEHGFFQCLQVANPDGLFLAGRGYVCTHNTKSEFASYLLPAWFLGLNPSKKVIQTSHTAELAVGFGRKVRNLVDSEVYQRVFPGVGLQSDSKAAGRWATNKGGDYFAIGVGGAVTGKGADILIIDDPHSEQEAALAEVNPEVYDKVYEWYTSGPRQRLQPGGAIVIVATRWSLRDLTGQVLKAEAQRGGEGWEVIEFPAILPSGNPLWPEFWSLKELEALKEELPNSKWMAQYQQDPTSEGAAIIKREWWKTWEADRPPPCDFILMAWDTAFEKSSRADYSALTTWGVFYHDNTSTGKPEANIILLNAFRERMEFPRLKQVAIDQYKSWQPDGVIIEKKASGAPLIYEMRSMGIPVQEFTPSKGNDKISRLNAVSDVFASGKVWAPATHWAEEVIDEVAAFPAGEHDDYCLAAGNTVLMANGENKCVEHVCTGEFVATPIGPCRVVSAGQTGVKPTKTVYFSDGAVIRATSNHPIATSKGWRNVEHLSPTDAILTVSILRRSTSWVGKLGLGSKQLNLTGTNTAGIQTQQTQRTDGILVGLAHGFTGMYGCFTTGLFRKVVTYITKTEIPVITGLRIWNAYLRSNTVPSIAMPEVYEEEALNSMLTLPVFARLRQSGTGHPQGVSGIENTPNGLSQKRINRLGGIVNRCVAISVKYAVLLLRAAIQKVKFALNPAMTINDVVGCVRNDSQNLINVRSAEGRFTLYKPRRNFAPPDVKVSAIVENEKPEPVYNLTVESAHCYFVNGVLTHNCDSVSLALMRFRKGGYIGTGLDAQDDPIYFKQNRNRGYY
jgi:predicted phage terminase large subunit-like protein